MSLNSIRTWSPQQDAIFSFVQDSDGHLVVRARAGTGKTTTIVEAVLRWKRANPDKSAIVCAFNTRIKDELAKRFVNTGVEVKTLHGIGLAACSKFRSNLKVEDYRKVDVCRADALAAKVCGRSCPDAIQRLVSKLHTKGREIAPHATKLGDLSDIQVKFDCEAPEGWENTQFTSEYIELKALEAMELAADVQNGDTIDFADMIFLPVRNGWLVGSYDLGVVDEAQDMTTAQLEVALGSVKKGGRMVVVGDNCQAIYGFRGADSESLDRLKTELQSMELGLNTTYRCGKSIVQLAQTWVPDFLAHESNSDGIIRDIPAEKLTSEAGPGDFILSRVNAPLVSIAMNLLRSGKRARVAGRDIGKGLVALLRKLKARSVPDLCAKIEAWAARETLRQGKGLESASGGRRAALQAKVEAIRDQAEMLTSLTSGAKNVDEVLSRTEALFTDDGLGDQGVVTCSSVHKSKGLEAKRVFVLRDTLRDWDAEERNICYVAVTRAMHELVWVNGANGGQEN